MQPGQIVTVTTENKRVVTTAIKPEDYTAWTQQKLVLTDASFAQIVAYLEDNFGKKNNIIRPPVSKQTGGRHF